MSSNVKKKTWTWRVSEKEQGIGLLVFVSKHCIEAPSNKAIKRSIDSKQCRVNGAIETFSSCSLKKGDVVSFSLLSSSFQKQLPSFLYEDEEMIAINKPSGLVTDSKTLGIKQGLLVHRLDKETSGVLLIAKTKKRQSELEELFKNQSIEKCYLAIVEGRCLKQSWVMDTKIEKKRSYAGQTIYGSTPSLRGKRAITHFTCLDLCKYASLLACFPKTGRTHQIRVHASEMGHPILGDRQYAKTRLSSFPATRNLLHAYRVQFLHPTTGKPICITAPLPHDFIESLSSLQLKEAKIHEHLDH